MSAARHVLVVVLLVAICGAAPTAFAATPGERAAARRFAAARDDPAKLRAFLAAMPKGGDLHNHLAGAVATEALIGWAADDGLCVDAGLTAVPAPVAGSAGPLGTLVGEPAVSCAAGQRPTADAGSDAAFRDELVRAWSMEGFDPAVDSGHDHFFATFGRFGLATTRKGDMLAAVANANAEQNVAYLETMVTRQGAAVAALAAEVGFDDDFAAMRRKLLAAGMPAVVAAAVADTDADAARVDALLACATAKPQPGCAVVRRYDFGVGRIGDPAVVFANLLLAFELQRADPRYVGVNLAAPEDHPYALRDYALQMRMVRYLRRAYPKAHVSLHAGELAAGLVADDDLRFHIRQAVRVAGAERIGHGVDLVHERGYRTLLRTMARRHLLVEVPLTSNAQILGVSGAAHPLRRYRAAGVPVALATDDPGISRTDMTREYEVAATEQGLGYRDLKDIARASLEHAFLPGASLWRAPGVYRRRAACARDVPGAGRPGRRCGALLRRSRKAALQWEQEARSRRFERAGAVRQ